MCQRAVIAQLPEGLVPVDPLCQGLPPHPACPMPTASTEKVQEEKGKKRLLIQCQHQLPPMHTCGCGPHPTAGEFTGNPFLGQRAQPQLPATPSAPQPLERGLRTRAPF